MAAAIRTDPDHERCTTLFENTSEPLVVPQLVVVEAAYLVGKLLGPTAEADFIRSLADATFELRPLETAELRRMADVMDTYGDLPLGSVDAAVIVTAESLGATTVATLDRRHFSVVRPAHIAAFELVP